MYPYYPFSDTYRRDRRSRRRDRFDLYERMIIDSQISNVNQSIINTGYMNNVYQQNIVNQVYRARRYRR